VSYKCVPYWFESRCKMLFAHFGLSCDDSDIQRGWLDYIKTEELENEKTSTYVKREIEAIIQEDRKSYTS